MMNRVGCVWMSCDEQGGLSVSWACIVGRILGPCISPLIHRYTYPFQGYNAPRSCDDTCLHRATACIRDRSWGCLLVPAVKSPSNQGTCRNNVCNTSQVVCKGGTAKIQGEEEASRPCIM